MAIWDSCTTIDWTANGVEDCGGSARGGMKKPGLAGAGSQKSATKAPHQAEASQKLGNIRLSRGERAKGHHWPGAEREQCACMASARGPEGLGLGLLKIALMQAPTPGKIRSAIDFASPPPRTLFTHKYLQSAPKAHGVLATGRLKVNSWGLRAGLSIPIPLVSDQDIHWMVLGA